MGAMCSAYYQDLVYMDMELDYVQRNKDVEYYMRYADNIYILCKKESKDTLEKEIKGDYQSIGIKVVNEKSDTYLGVRNWQDEKGEFQYQSVFKNIMSNVASGKTGIKLENLMTSMNTAIRNSSTRFTKEEREELKMLMISRYNEEKLRSEENKLSENSGAEKERETTGKAIEISRKVIVENILKKLNFEKLECRIYEVRLSSSLSKLITECTGLKEQFKTVSFERKWQTILSKVKTSASALQKMYQNISSHKEEILKEKSPEIKDIITITNPNQYTMESVI
jgi:hypothetical protein